MRSAVLALVLVAVALLPLASAWWCTGHMVIASIAKANIPSDLARRVDSIIYGLSQSGPFPESPDMIQAACWADDLKRNQRAMASWHFINQQYTPTSYQVPPGIALQEENVATTIPQMQDSIYHYPNTWEMAFAVANLIHFVGDLHQPLHCAELFTTEYPTGDHGGNDIPVTVPAGNRTELHAVWDSVCWTQSVELTRPLTSAGWNTVNQAVAMYTNLYPMSSFTSADIMLISNTTLVAQQSFNLAVAYAYDNNTITSGETLPQSYMAQCQIIAGKQLALAGYRLAHAIQYAFGSNNERHLSGAERSQRIMDRMYSMMDNGKHIDKNHHH